DRAPHQLDRLLRGMVEFFLFRSAHYEFWRRRIPNGRVFAGLPEPRSVLLPDIPAGLVLEPVVRPREHGPAFIPDDLLVMKEPNPEQAIEDLPGEFRCMPNVRDLERRD